MWYALDRDTVAIIRGYAAAELEVVLPRVYRALIAQPSQFELGTMAVVRTICTDAKTFFPDQPVSDFVKALRDAAASP